jgi:hypothetical protein
MAFVLKDRVRESSTTTGTGPIALGGAPNTSYQAFSAVMSIGDTCWASIVLPGSAWQTALCTYSALNTLTITTVLESSNGGAAVSFTTGTKDIYITQPASQAQPRFPTGTLMLFQQSAAPIYWTKQTTHNDKALRVVSGTASNGGTNAFSTVMAQTVVGSHALTITEMPSHSHGGTIGGATISVVSSGGASVLQPGGSVLNNGGGAAHNHTISMDVAYVDLIVAQKD